MHWKLRNFLINQGIRYSARIYTARPTPKIESIRKYRPPQIPAEQGSTHTNLKCSTVADDHQMIKVLEHGREMGKNSILH